MTRSAPVLFGSLAGYRSRWLRRDLVAGLTVWAVLVPESLAYATIAGVSPVVGLYAAVPALVLYAAVGSSRHLVVGPMSATAALSAGIVGTFIAAGDPRYAVLAGRPAARRALDTTLLLETVGEYVLSGRRVRSSWIWRLLSRHEARPTTDPDLAVVAQPVMATIEPGSRSAPAGRDARSTSRRASSHRPLPSATNTSRIGAVTRPGRSVHGEFTGDGTVSGFIEATDGVRIHVLRWPADARAVVVFLHGIASHGGWFGETATVLAREGVAVYAPDRRGSGCSDGPRGHLAGYHRALDDVELVLGLAAAEHPETPVFLAGSSWAAKLAIVYAALRPARLSGLLLLGPGLLPRVSLNPPRRAAVVVGHLAAPRLQVRIPLGPEMYTANPSYVDFVRADPLRLLTATAQFFWTTAVLDRRRARAAGRLRLPVLLLQGEADAMVDVPATRRWFDELPAADKTYRAYPGAGHTLDFEPEPNRGRYLTDLRDWLSARALAGP